MSDFHGFDGSGRRTLRGWWAYRQLWLADIAHALGVLWCGSVGLWLLGLGWWWLHSNGTGQILALSALVDFLARRSGDQRMLIVQYVPWPFVAFPGELLLVSGLVLIVNAVRRLAR